MAESDAPLMLSVSGMRGIVGRSLTPELVARYAASFGTWLRSQAEGVAVHVVVGRDSRVSGPMYEQAATAGLLGVGCHVTQLGVASTPGVGVMIGHLGAQGGMVITASHNPIVWNGLKPLRADGVAPSADQSKGLIERFKAGQVEYVDVTGVAGLGQDASAAEAHCAAVARHVDVEAIRGAGLKAVVDSVHGAGGPEARLLLEHLGVELVGMYSEPTGRFPHEPEPVKENLTELAGRVASEGADVGFAQDPDADRLAVVDEAGRYIGEEYTLALCAKHVLKAGDVAVANLSTSRMIDDVAQEAGATVVRTPVGEANVAAAMQREGAVIGGEGNGGVIWPKVSYVRDSLAGMALLLEMLAERKRRLSELVGEVPRYAIVKEKVPADGELVGRMGTVLQQTYADQRVDEQDGVRVDWADQWVHVRPSNTEPIVRLIAEAPQAEQATGRIAEVREALGLS